MNSVSRKWITNLQHFTTIIDTDLDIRQTKTTAKSPDLLETMMVWRKGRFTEHGSTPAHAWLLKS